MALLSLSVTSCNNKDIPLSKNEQKRVLKDSKIVLYENTLNQLRNIGISKKKSENEVWNIVYSSFRIIKDGEELRISEYFQKMGVKEEDTKKTILDKVFLFEHPYISQTRSGAQKKPSLEEIRDAMLEECRNGYIEPVTTLCEIAVKIAYYYKKTTDEKML